MLRITIKREAITMQYTIIIDDDDRDDAPDHPWTATLDQSAESGIGATPISALEDLAKSWRANPALAD